MMNARIIELIQYPQNLCKEDIAILEKEIAQFPFMQSIRTLQLSAIYDFDKENYQKHLTKTAAFTTDKKILYQFINKKTSFLDRKEEAQRLKKLVFAKTETENIKNVTETEQKAPATTIDLVTTERTEISNGNEIISTNQEITKNSSIVSDTELETSILDKKEILNEVENFYENEAENAIVEEPNINAEKAEEIEVISVDNQLVTEERPKQEIVFKTREEDLNFSKETLLDRMDQISEKDEEITLVKPSEISFNGFDSFLPEVRFTVPQTKTEIKEEPVVIENVEIKTFVEEKILESKEKVELLETPSVENTQQNEEVKMQQQNNSVETEIEEARQEILEQEPIEEPTVIEDWKPMSFVQNPLDATIKTNKSVEIKIEELTKPAIKETYSQVIETEPPKEELPKEEEEKNEERPVINTSFFTPEIAVISVEKVEESAPAKVEIKEETNHSLESNVPSFVNTWQNWLKIDRSPSIKQDVQSEVHSEKIIEKKADIIEKFIEENPKISQLKEEVQFVVKEKAVDISHLMTETLAKLYVEQRLYSKAIKAYEILKVKHPEKSDYYNSTIQEVKELRSQK